MKLKRLKNRGSVDVTAWLAGMVGFASSYFVWVFISPVIRQLIAFGMTQHLPDVANGLFTFINTLMDYALIINAAVWLIYILLSSVKDEVVERGFLMEY
jgi:hypothetical protein